MKAITFIYLNIYWIMYGVIALCIHLMLRYMYLKLNMYMCVYPQESCESHVTGAGSDFSKRIVSPVYKSQGS